MLVGLLEECVSLSISFLSLSLSLMRGMPLGLVAPPDVRGAFGGVSLSLCPLSLSLSLS